LFYSMLPNEVNYMINLHKIGLCDVIYGSDGGEWSFVELS
jgi:hypothetical protein